MPYKVEYAASSRAKCKAGKSCTDKVFRACVTPTVLQHVGSVDNLEGFSSLKPEDQEAVKAKVEGAEEEIKAAEKKKEDEKAAKEAEKEAKKKAKEEAKALKAATKGAKVSKKEKPPAREARPRKAKTEADYEE
ncbi:hypothetical protein HK103_007568 [Boothiomyces macroporosus]|uniref:PARP-type domain-containing protein n=1 Tax=Boothiomyces macroporosus TaxID=261099 RepID=A0AAD5Y5V0_9FUNG|nr:hypothetical protein HK103_007568 [Boothiomyces macroporosus]